MPIDDLNEANALIYAAKHYDNPHFFDTVEFYEDLSRFKYLKKLFGRYEESGELNERLVLNHLIVIYNVFGVEPATRMLFVKLVGQYHLLKPFLVLLGTLPRTVDNIGIKNETIVTSGIPMDPKISELLRNI